AQNLNGQTRITMRIWGSPRPRLQMKSSVLIASLLARTTRTQIPTTLRRWNVSSGQLKPTTPYLTLMSARNMTTSARWSAPADSEGQEAPAFPAGFGRRKKTSTSPTSSADGRLDKAIAVALGISSVAFSTAVAVAAAQLGRRGGRTARRKSPWNFAKQPREPPFLCRFQGRHGVQAVMGPLHSPARPLGELSVAVLVLLVKTAALSHSLAHALCVVAPAARLPTHVMIARAKALCTVPGPLPFVSQRGSSTGKRCVWPAKARQGLTALRPETSSSKLRSSRIRSVPVKAMTCT